MRDSSIYTLLQALSPEYNGLLPFDDHMTQLYDFACEQENAIFSMASSKAEYFGKVAEKAQQFKCSRQEAS